MASASDRRKRIRVPVQNKIRHSIYQVLGTPVFEENSAVDLSTSGISFETAQEYKKGTLVLLEVEIEGELLKLLVCVAWIKKNKKSGKFLLGAELVAIDPEHKKQMSSHLHSLIQKLAAQKKSKKKTKKKPAKKTKKKTAKKKSLSKKKKRRA